MSSFSIDSPFMEKLDRFTDLLGLAVITAACCVPIVTIGASLTAMYTVAMKMAKGEDGKVFKPFLKAFAQNFKKSTIMWIICLAFMAVFYGDYYMLYQSGIEFSVNATRVLTLASGGMLLLCLFAVTYVFPLQAYFENTVKNTIKNALVMSIFRLPKTILLLVINLLPLAVGFIYPILWPPALLVEFAFCSYLSSVLYVGIFKYFTEAQQKANAEDEAHDTDIAEPESEII